TLIRGTKTRTGPEIASTIEQVGGGISAASDLDSLHVGVDTLSENAKLAFDLLGDVVLNPTFPTDEMNTNRQKMLTNLQFALADPSDLASRTFNSLVYGKHPYGNLPTEQTIKAFSRDAVVNYYRQQSNPENAFLIVVGDIAFNDALKYAEATFGQWKTMGTGT